MSLSDFKNKFGDLLRPNYYEVNIEPPKELKGFNPDVLDSFKYLIVSTDFPFETIATQELNVMSRKYAIANDIDYDPVTISFNLDAKGLLLDFFQQWKRLIINDDNKLGYYNDYVGAITIKMLDLKKNSIFSVKLINAYPVNRQNIMLSSQSENAFTDWTVSFVYLRPEYTHSGSIYKDTYNPNDFEKALKTYFGGGVNYNPSSSDFMIWNPFELDTKSALSNLQYQITSQINKFDLDKKISVNIPIIGDLSTSFSNLIGSKYKTSITTGIQTKINQLQSSITDKYKDLQSKTISRLQTSIKKTINKIFKF